jgi:ABC-type multidrug transport system ATPase subunit
LTKTFKGVNALKSLNLTVHQNSIFGLLGPNGAGLNLERSSAA